MTTHKTLHVVGFPVTHDHIEAAIAEMKRLRHFTKQDIINVLEAAGVPERFAKPPRPSLVPIFYNRIEEACSWYAAQRLLQELKKAGKIGHNKQERKWHWLDSPDPS